MHLVIQYKWRKEVALSKAFTKETDSEEEPERPEIQINLKKNYVTPHGHHLLQTELRQLMGDERRKVVETVRWAAGNGDRSENGDYIYGKKRLREIDRRVRYLTKRLESAVVVDPVLQKNLQQVYFGATVTYRKEDATEITLQIVGVDEADSENKISWVSPVAKALLKSKVGDVVTIRTPEKNEKVRIIAIRY